MHKPKPAPKPAPKPKPKGKIKASHSSSDPASSKSEYSSVYYSSSHENDHTNTANIYTNSSHTQGNTDSNNDQNLEAENDYENQADECSCDVWISARCQFFEQGGIQLSGSGLECAQNCCQASYACSCDVWDDAQCERFLDGIFRLTQVQYSCAQNCCGKAPAKQVNKDENLSAIPRPDLDVAESIQVEPSSSGTQQFASAPAESMISSVAWLFLVAAAVLFGVIMAAFFSRRKVRKSINTRSIL